MISRSNEFTAEQYYLSWENQYSGNKYRFTAKMRREALNHLCDIFIGANFTIDDLNMFKRRALDFLISESGKKRRGKHADGQWVEDAYVDFDKIAADNFIKAMKSKSPESYGSEFSQYRQEIADWVKKKFNSDNASLIKEAHRIGGLLYLDFIQETFYT